MRKGILYAYETLTGCNKPLPEVIDCCELFGVEFTIWGDGRILFSGLDEQDTNDCLSVIYESDSVKCEKVTRFKSDEGKR